MLKFESSRILEQGCISSTVANAMSEKLIDTLMSKNQIEEIEDDRFAHAISRSNSRFAAPVTPNEVLSIDFHPSGNALAYSRVDGSLTIWLLTGASFARSKKIYLTDAIGTDKIVHSLSWNPNEIAQFATVGNSSEIFIWGIDEKKRSLTKLRSLSIGTKMKIFKCLYDPTGSWLLAVTKSNELHLFDAKNDHELHSVLDINNIIAEDSVHSICWNNSGSHVFVGLNSGKLAVLKLNSADEFEMCIVVPSHRGPITSIRVEPWGRFVITGSTDGSCGIWELSTLTCLTLLDDLDASVLSLDIDSMGKIIGVCTSDGNLQFYDINSGQRLFSQNFKKFGSDLVFKFYPDKTWFVLSGKDDSLQRHFTPSQYNDPLSLWKSEYEKTLLGTRNKNTNRRPLKRERENEVPRERTRMPKRERDQPRASRFADKHA